MISVLASLSGLLIGYSTAVIAAALPFVVSQFFLSPLMEGVVVSAVLAGAFVGSILAGVTVQRLGERPLLFVVALLFLAGGLGSAVSDSLAGLLLWRTVIGFGVGAATMVVPLYVSETAPSRLRGALVSSIQLAITVGILLSYLLGVLWTPSGNWRAMFGAGVVPAVLMLTCAFLVPESPRWLFYRGRREAAKASYLLIAGDGGHELSEIEKSTATLGGSWKELFSPRVRPALAMSIGLFAFANLSGIDAILYYAPRTFAQIGGGGTLASILATTGIGAVNVAATIVSLWFIDRLGRRPLLIIGLVPMAISLLILSGAVGFGQSSEWTNGVTLLCLCVFVAAFAISLGPLPYVLMSEVFPLALRGPGMGLAAAAAWAVNVIVSLTFPPFVAALGVACVFGFYGLVSVIALLFTIAFVPETRGRTLEHIETNLALGLRVRDLGKEILRCSHMRMD